MIKRISVLFLIPTFILFNFEHIVNTCFGTTQIAIICVNLDSIQEINLVFLVHASMLFIVWFSFLFQFVDFLRMVESTKLKTNNVHKHFFS
jgi:hypothetical protein